MFRMILKELVVGMFQVNCYLVGSETTKEAMVIDPGDSAKTILKAARDSGLSIVLIVNTHGHMDHIMAIHEVKAETGAPYAVHKDEASFLQATARGASAFTGATIEPPPPPDRLLEDGDTIQVGDLSFTVLHTPGHTPGGICLLGQGHVFTGDTLFNFSIGRTDFPGGNYDQLMKSIKSKLMVLPDDTIVLPGHGPRSTIGNEREWNPFLVQQER